MEVMWRIPPELQKGYLPGYPPHMEPLAADIGADGEGTERALVLFAHVEKGMGNFEAALALIRGPRERPAIEWVRSRQHVVATRNLVTPEGNRLAVSLVGQGGVSYVVLYSALLRNKDNTEVAAPLLVLRDSDWSFTYLEHEGWMNSARMLPGHRLLIEQPQGVSLEAAAKEELLYSLDEMPWFPNGRLDSPLSERCELLKECRARCSREQAHEAALRYLKSET